MYRAIVVDDEPRVRKGLRALIPALDPEWTVAGEAKNGLEAIELVKKEKPDLVITDIRMPHMNGLDLLSALKEYPVHVVILSGYGYFEYAQTAVKFGAFDYLLKPVKPPEIKSMLERLKSVCKSRAQDADSGGAALNFSKWWKGWLTGDEEAAAYAEELEALLPRGTDRCQIMTIEIDRFDELITEDQWGDRQLVAFAVRNIVQDLTAGDELRVVFLFAGGSRLHYLVAGPACERGMAHRLIDAVRRWVKISISVGLSESMPRFGELPRLYAQAEEALRNKWIHGEGLVCSYEDAALADERSVGYPTELDEALCRAVRACDTAAAAAALAGFLERIRAGQASFALFQRFGLQLLSSVCRIVYESRLQDTVLREVSRPQEMFRREFTAEEYDAFMRELIAASIRALEWHRAHKSERAIERAIAFIRDNADRDISLEDVAQHVRMSGGYFSSFFKQETGDNFIDYLTRLRIDRAKQLMMSSELRLYEISKLVGYQDVKYFSRLFKRHVGATPAEYRQFFDPKEE